MFIRDILNRPQPSLSFEVFPPRNDASMATVRQAAESIAGLQPSFISVTYGAGGGTGAYTAALAADLQDKYQVPALAHLSCLGASRQDSQYQLDLLQARHIHNILALRGDRPEGAAADQASVYHHASDLIADIKARGGFCIGAACYPEGHPESPSQREDIRHLRDKAAAGCDFLTSQMFFDNNIFYNFMYKVRDAGIAIPVIPGIMPVTHARQIRRILALSGTVLPQRFRYILDRFGDNPATMQEAGIAYATEQIIDLLANGVPAVHVYSMNHPQVAAKIFNNLEEILKG
ncbi:MAG: methylenetetrahydrofolate reductase [Oscillospiraceae bacterium]|nr:methylenetetrahydrofolate reductase [Oscillospiraceae bacterium]MDD4368197.1 methylenetetrahydrofolate reductase [Oscillospiraceae bacterium]